MGLRSKVRGIQRLRNSRKIKNNTRDNIMGIKRMIRWIATVGAVLVAVAAQAADKKPNILVIWGDDIGYSNISAYNLGVMGYRTPNIDRIAKEGAIFTDAYAQQSCT